MTNIIQFPNRFKGQEDETVSVLACDECENKTFLLHDNYQIQCSACGYHISGLEWKERE